MEKSNNSYGGSNDEQAINVNVANYSGEKPIEVVIRKGVAAKVADPLPTLPPITKSFLGTLGCVSEWLSKRVTEIDQKEAHITVDRCRSNICLVINESDPYLRSEIEGAVSFTKEFIKFGINDADVVWEPCKLGNYFSMNRSMFRDKTQAMELVSRLKNFTAKANSEIEKQRDPSGSRADVYRTIVESNLPKSFTLRLGIINGMPKTDVEVEFDYYLEGGQCMLQLVSPECEEALPEYTDSCIDHEIEIIRGLAPEIAILEKYI